MQENISKESKEGEVMRTRVEVKEIGGVATFFEYFSDGTTEETPVKKTMKDGRKRIGVQIVPPADNAEPQILEMFVGADEAQSGRYEHIRIPKVQILEKTL